MTPSTTGAIPLLTGLAYLCECYRVGIRSAGQTLLDQHADRLTAWIRLLAEGVNEPDNLEMLRFLAMLESTVKSPAELKQGLSYLEPDDLIQEVRVAFLQTAYEGRLLKGGFIFTLRDRLLPLLAQSPNRPVRRRNLKLFLPGPMGARKGD